MARPLVVPLLIFSMLLCGCGTARQSVYRDGGESSEVAEKATASSGGVFAWLDDHPIIKYTGLGALAVTVGILTGLLLFAAMIAAISSSIH